MNLSNTNYSSTGRTNLARENALTSQNVSPKLSGDEDDMSISTSSKSWQPIPSALANAKTLRRGMLEIRKQRGDDVVVTPGAEGNKPGVGARLKHRLKRHLEGEWKKRQCILSTSSLALFKDIRGQHASQIIFLEEASVQIEMSEERPYTFRLRATKYMKEGRVKLQRRWFVCDCQTSENLEAWVAAIKSAINMQRPRSSSLTMAGGFTPFPQGNHPSSGRPNSSPLPPPPAPGLAADPTEDGWSSGGGGGGGGGPWGTGPRPRSMPLPAPAPPPPPRPPFADAPPPAPGVAAAAAAAAGGPAGKEENPWVPPEEGLRLIVQIQEVRGLPYSVIAMDLGCGGELLGDAEADEEVHSAHCLPICELEIVGNYDCAPRGGPGAGSAAAASAAGAGSGGGGGGARRLALTHPGRPAGPPGAVRFAGETLALDLGPGEWLAGALELRVVRQEPLLPHRLLGRATAPLANVGLLQPAQGASMETTCLPLRQGGTEEPGGAQLLVCMNLVLSPELSNRAWELGDADALKQDLLEKLQGKADGKPSMMPPPQSVGPRLFVQPLPPALPPRRRPSAARDENGKDQVGNLHLQSTANLPASSEKDAGLSQAAALLTSLVEDFERFACGTAPPEPPGETLARLRALAALLPSTGRAMAEGGGGNSGGGGGGGRQPGGLGPRGVPPPPPRCPAPAEREDSINTVDSGWGTPMSSTRGSQMSSTRGSQVFSQQQLLFLDEEESQASTIVSHRRQSLSRTSDNSAAIIIEELVEDEGEVGRTDTKMMEGKAAAVADSSEFCTASSVRIIDSTTEHGGNCATTPPVQRKQQQCRQVEAYLFDTVSSNDTSFKSASGSVNSPAASNRTKH